MTDAGRRIKLRTEAIGDIAQLLARYPTRELRGHSRELKNLEKELNEIADELTAEEPSKES